MADVARLRDEDRHSFLLEPRHDFGKALRESGRDAFEGTSVGCDDAEAPCFCWPGGALGGEDGAADADCFCWPGAREDWLSEPDA